MIKYLTFLFTFFLFMLIIQCTPGKSKTSVLVVTGGHGYDTAEFVAMFEAMEGLEYETALKPDAWTMLAKGMEFDVIVFYDMWQEISEKEKKVFLSEFDRGTGMVFLHHSLVSHQEWPGYTQLTGGKYFQPKYTSDTSKVSGYRHDITLQVRVLDVSHPVTEGVGDFEIFDEGYSNILVLPGVHHLLETNHPDCDRYIGWSHVVKNSRVVYLMGGHDKQAYENKSFNRLVNNAILWTGENWDLEDHKTNN